MTEYVTNTKSDIFADISLGLMGGTAPGAIIRRVTRLGQCTIAGSGVAANDLWTNGGIYPWMTAATSLEAVSVGVSAANDAAAGTGARTITVSGLDIAGAEISEVVTMNGVTAVALATQFYRINSVGLTTVGSGLRNAGEIRIRDAGAGTTRAVVPVAAVADLTPGVDKGSQYTVPAGHALLIYDIDIQINSSAGGGTRGADMLFYFRGPNATSPVRMPRAMSCTDVSAKSLDPKTRILVPALNDFQLRCSYTSNAGMIISGSWEGLLFRRIP
jgi:hypothetical protein